MSDAPTPSQATRLGPWGWFAIAVLLAFLAAAIAYALYAWNALGAVAIPATGWLFLILGIVVTILFGGGLMELLFYSSRKGRDF
jgi:hypothetical protein